MEKSNCHYWCSSRSRSEIAKILSAQGTQLVLLGLEPEKLSQITQGLPSSAHFWEVDVTDQQRLRAVIPEIISRFGRIDVVIANAGIGASAPVEYSDPASFNKIIEVNLIGSGDTARSLARGIIKRKHTIYVQQWIRVLSLYRSMMFNPLMRWIMGLRGDFSAQWLESQAMTNTENSSHS